jgi:hypothetical protein
MTGTPTATRRRTNTTPSTHALACIPFGVFTRPLGDALVSTSIGLPSPTSTAFKSTSTVANFKTHCLCFGPFCVLPTCTIFGRHTTPPSSNRRNRLRPKFGQNSASSDGMRRSADGFAFKKLTALNELKLFWLSTLCTGNLRTAHLYTSTRLCSSSNLQPPTNTPHYLFEM